MVDVEYEELKVRDQADHDKDNHVDVPVEAKVQQNFGVTERSEIHLQLIGEVLGTARVKAELDFTGHYDPLLGSLLVVPDRDCYLFGVLTSSVITLRVQLARH